MAEAGDPTIQSRVIAWLAVEEKNQARLTLVEVDEDQITLKAANLEDEAEGADDDDDDDWGDDGDDDWGEDDKTFQISIAQPHYFSTEASSLQDLESEMAKYCFSDDKGRTIEEILVFATQTLVTLKQRQDEAWDEDSEEDMEAEPELRQAPKLTRQQSYQVSNLERLADLQRDMITSASNHYGITLSAAGILLRKHGWNREKLDKAYSPDVCEKAGVKETLHQVFLPSSDDSAEFECGICMEDVLESDSFALNCGHRFCLDCYKDHMRSALESGTASGASVLTLQCPSYKCPTIVGEEVFQMLLGGEEYSTYQKRMLLSFVDENEDCSWCVGTSCNRVIVFSSRKQNVQCECGQKFCFRCKGAAHAPAKCSQYELWVQRDKGSENLDTKFLMDQTKPCPHCGVRTKKEGGCMYVNCTQCKKPWCWQCGQSDHHVWECNRPKYGKTSAKDDENDINRYLWYYERYFNHMQSLKFAEEQRTKAREKMTSMVGEGVSYKHTCFLIEAIDTVIECREVLKWTYAYAFYTEDVHKRELFEFQQRKLEDYTEKLSQKTEEEISKLIEHRRDVMEYREAIARYLEGIKAC